MELSTRPFNATNTGLAFSVLFTTGLALPTLNLFGVAYACFFLAGLWVATSWWLSEHLSENARALAVLRTALWLGGDSSSEYRTKYRRFAVKKYGVLLLILSAMCLCIMWVHAASKAFDLSQEKGKIYPANEPLPTSHACDRIQTPDSLLVFMGKAGIGLANKFPMTVFRRMGNDLLTIDRNPDGSMAISLEIRGRDGNLIARMKRGEFKISKSDTFDIDRPDYDRLTVSDKKGITVLDLRYFNPRAVWINFVSEGFEIRGSVEDAIMTLSCRGSHLPHGAMITNNHPDAVIGTE